MVAASPLRAGSKQPNDLKIHPDKTCTKEGGKKARRETFQPAPIPLLDLTRKYRSIEAELHRQWNLTFESMRLLNGRNLASSKTNLPRYCDVRHAVGVASGTDAIFLSLRALKMGSGDEVILPAHAPAPVIEPILYLGATPVLIDKVACRLRAGLEGFAGGDKCQYEGRHCRSSSWSSLRHGCNRPNRQGQWSSCR